MKKIIAALLIVTTAAMSGRASNMSSRDYSQATAMQKMKVELGVVDSVRDVKINGKPSPSVFLRISTHFTATRGIPSPSTVL